MYAGSIMVSHDNSDGGRATVAIVVYGVCRFGCLLCAPVMGMWAVLYSRLNTRLAYSRLNTRLA